MQHAEADLYKCEMCDAEQTRMIQRTAQGDKGGSTNGLFIRWFPKGEKIVKRFLTWKGDSDG